MFPGISDAPVKIVLNSTRTQVVWLAGDAAEKKEGAVCSPTEETLGIPCHWSSGFVNEGEGLD